MAGLSSGGGGGQKPATPSVHAAPLAPSAPAAAAAAGAARAPPRAAVPAPPLLFRRWTPDEDEILLAHAALHGTRHWSSLHQSGRLKDRDNKACCNRFRILKKQQRTRGVGGAGGDEGSPRTSAEGGAVSPGMEGYALGKAVLGPRGGLEWGEDRRGAFSVSGAASGPSTNESTAAPSGQDGALPSPSFRHAPLHLQQQQYEQQQHQQLQHQQQRQRQQQQQQQQHQQQQHQQLQQHQGQLQQSLMASWMGGGSGTPPGNHMQGTPPDQRSLFGSAAHLADAQFPNPGTPQSPSDASLLKLAAAGGWMSPVLAQNSPLWSNRHQQPIRSHSLDLPPHMAPHPGRTMSLHASAWGNLQQVYSNASLLGRSPVAASLFPPPWGPLPVPGPHSPSPSQVLGASSSWLSDNGAGLGMAMPMGALWASIGGGGGPFAEGGFVGPSHGGPTGTPHSGSLSPVLIDQSTHSPVGFTSAQELHAPPAAVAPGAGANGGSGSGAVGAGAPRRTAPTPAVSSGSIIELRPGTTIVSPSLPLSSPHGPPKPSVFRASVGSGAGPGLEPAFGQVNASLASSSGQAQHGVREGAEGSGGQSRFGPVLQQLEEEKGRKQEGGHGAGFSVVGLSDTHGGPRKGGVPFGVGRCYLSLSESEQGAAATSKHDSPLPPCTDISDGRSSLGFAARVPPPNGAPGSDLGLRLMQTGESQPLASSTRGAVDDRPYGGPRGACDGENAHVPSLSHSHSGRGDEGSGASSRADKDRGAAPSLFNSDLHTQLQALHAADQMPVPSPRVGLGRRGSLVFSADAEDGMQLKRQRMM